MRYQIRHTNGKTRLIDNNSINTELSIRMVGQNYTNYSDIFFDSFGKIVSIN
jgi:hypothetical protein